MCRGVWGPKSRGVWGPMSRLIAPRIDWRNILPYVFVFNMCLCSICVCVQYGILSVTKRVGLAINYIFRVNNFCVWIFI